MFKSVKNNDFEISENGNEYSGLYDLFKDEISDLGESSTDWWRERSDSNNLVNTRIMGSQSPVFKTPQFNLQTRKSRKSCIGSSGQKRSRATSPKGNEPLEFFSPFKSSRLSPITPSVNSVPESLEALLQDGSEISWNSAFATPLNSNVTWSNFNSEEKKLFMPSKNTSKSPHISFTPESESEQQLYCGPDNNNEDNFQHSTVLFENTAIEDKYDIVCYSTPNRKKTVCNRTLVANRTEGSNSKDFLVSFREIKRNDDDQESDLQTNASLNNSKKERKFGRKYKKCSLIMSPDSDMNEFATISTEIDLGMSSPLVSAGNVVSRQLFQKNDNTGISNVQLEEDSGAVGSREESNAKLSDASNLIDCFQQNSLLTNEEVDSSAINQVTYSELEKTEDLPKDLSFNTLEEIRQATEILAANAESQIECCEEKSSLFLHNDAHMSRTSTPISKVEMKSKLDSDTKKKKIKFVQAPASGIMLLSESLNCREELTTIVDENKIKCYNERENRTDSMPDLLPMLGKLSTKDNTADCVSRIRIIKSAVNQGRKFAYIPSVIDLKTAVDKSKESTKVMIQDVIESAYALESVIENSNKSRYKVQNKLMNPVKNTPGFVSFCKLQSFSHSLVSIKDSELDKSNGEMIGLNDKDKFKDTNERKKLNNSNSDSVLLQTTDESLSNLTNIYHENIEQMERNHVCAVAEPFAENETSNSKLLNYMTQHNKVVEEYEATALCDKTVDIEYSSTLADHCVTEPTDERKNDNTKEEKCNNLKNVKHMKTFCNESNEDVFNLMEYRNDHEDTMTDSQMVQIAEHAELIHNLTEDGSVFSQCASDTRKNIKHSDKQGEFKDEGITVSEKIGTGVENSEIMLEESRISAALSTIYSQEVRKANLVLQKLHSENVQKEFSGNSNQNQIRNEPRSIIPNKKEINVKSRLKNDDNIEEILNSSIIRQFFNEGTEKDFSEMSSQNINIANAINSISEKIPKNMEKSFSDASRGNKLEDSFLIMKHSEALGKSHVLEKETEMIIVNEDEAKFNALASLKVEKENVPVLENTKVENINEVPVLVDTSLKSSIIPADGEASCKEECEREPLKMKDINKRNSIQLAENKFVIGTHNTTDRDLKIVEFELLKATTKNIGISEFKQLHKNSFTNNKFHNKIENSVELLNVSVNNISQLTEILQETELNFSEEMSLRKTCSVDDGEREITLMNPSETHVNTQKGKSFLEKDVSNGITPIFSNGEDNAPTPVSGQECDNSKEAFNKPVVLFNNESEHNLNSVQSQISDDVTINKSPDKINLDILAKFQGFSITSGQKQNSQEVLNNFKTVFAEEMFEKELAEIEKCVSFLNEPNTALSEFHGFSTAIGKKISVSEDAINNARILFSDEIFENKVYEDKINVTNLAKPSTTTSKFQTIAKVSEKKISVSEEALNTVNILSSEDVEKPKTTSISEFQEFPIVSGREIPVPLEPLKISREISIAEENLNKNVCSISEPEVRNDLASDIVISSNKSVIGNQLKFKELASAKDKEMFVSEESIDKVEISENLVCDKASSEKIISPTLVPGTTNTGEYSKFTTSDSVNSSLKTLYKRKIVGNDVSTNINMPSLENQAMISKAEIKGFTTASGRKINVSEDSLNKVKVLFSEDEFDLELPISKSRKDVSELQCVSTASGKEGFVSHEALNNTKCKKAAIENTLQSKDKLSKLQGVSTPNGKEVSVSEAAVSRTKFFFSEEDTFGDKVTAEPTLLSTNKPTITFQGFSTASDKEVVVSEAALNKVKLLFSEEDAFGEKVTVEPTLPIANKTTKFQGFSTASGKEVSVSEDALNRAKLLFSEDAFCEKAPAEPTLPSTSKPTTKFHDFSVAGGKEVSVSEAVLKSAKVGFSEGDTFVKKVTGEPTLPSTSKLTTKFQGFSTASGKEVSVSEDALNRAKLLFSEEDTFGEKALTEPTLLTANKPTTKFQGFSTASGKEVSVSEDSLNRAKLLFSEEDTFGEKALTEPTLLTANKPTTKFQGFSTASGKEVSVSEDALNRAKLLFSEEDAFGEKAHILPSANKPTTKFQGFSTASGKEVSVSEDALNRAKRLFSEENTFVEKAPVEPTLPSTSKPTTKFQGFSTASGKEVSVSEDSLSRAKLLFSEEDTFVEKALAEPTLLTANKPTTKFQGFSTASGKEVSVSEDSLNRAKLLFSEEDTFGEKALTEPTLLTANKPTTKFQGFSTASGKEVSVSEDALNRAKLLFSEENTFVEKAPVEPTLPSTSKPTTKFQGFSTASGKEVSVSEDALNRAKLLFSEEDTFVEKAPVEPTLPSTSKPTRKFQGFSTASGKEVSVSEDALNRAKLLFSEEDTFVEKITAEPTLPSKSKPTTKFQDFSATNCKESSVSEGAVNWATFLCTENDFDIKMSDTFIATNKLNPKTSKFQTFSTDDKDIPISESLLNQAFSEDELKNEFSNCGFAATSTVDKSVLDVPNVCGIATTDCRQNLTSLENLKRARHFLENISISETDSSDLKYTNVISDIKYLDSPKINEILNDDYLIDKASDLKLSPVLKSSLTSNKIAHISSEKRIRGRLSLSRKGSISNKLKSSVKQENLNVSEVMKNDNMNMSNIFRNKSAVNKLNRKYVNLISDVKELRKGDIIQNYSVDKEKFENNKVLSFTQEVKESAAALLADEDTLNSQSWSYISCPDMVYDHPSAPAAMVCSEETVTETKVTGMCGSPVLGRNDRNKRKRKSKSSQNSSPSSFLQSSQKSSSSGFKVPYKNITPSGETSTSTPTIRRVGRQLDFSIPFCKRLRVAESSMTEKTCKDNCVIKKEVCVDVAAGRKSAAETQDALIKNKLSMGPTSRPCKGSYYLCKLERHLQRRWQDMVEGEVPGNYTRKELLAFGVKESTTNVTSENAVEFRFSAWDHYSASVCHGNISGLLVGDGAHLILDIKGTAGVDEVTRAFLSSVGVESALVPAGWIANHYRWIIWKLAATECSFPQQFAARCLVPNMLFLQLKYRYDREIDDCQRPAIRKILEHDDSPAKRLVLCVSRIFKLDSTGDGTQYELELTDGWYGITASVDQELMQRIHRGTITIGTKLISYGAELVNCDQGCSPFEVGSEVRLKLFSNSTRRARWDTKLGYCSHPGPILISLSSVLPNGGMVSGITLTVVRVYPVLYVEKLEDGKSVFRSVRAEERANALWERKRQECIEVLYSQARKELSQEDAKNTYVKPWHIPNAQELSVICSGDRLTRILELAPDPASVEVLMNEEQKIAVNNYQREKNERLQQELQVRVKEKLEERAIANRNVVELFKVRCVDPSTSISTKSAVLSVWRPSEDMSQLLKEGNILKVFNIQAAGMRNGNLQLSAGRQTAYKPVLHSHCDLYKRTVTHLNEAPSSDFQPLFGELDVVGMVVYVSPAPQGNSGFQTVYLADSDFSILGVAFWAGIKNFCWEEILKLRTVVATSNLQWRHGAAMHWIPCAYATELTTFSSHPRQSHLQEALTALNQQIKQQGLESFYATCEEKVTKLLQGAISPVSGLVSVRNATLGNSDSVHIGRIHVGVRTPPNKKRSMNSPGSVQYHINASKLHGSLQELHLNSTSIIEYGDSPLDRRLDKLRQYGDAAPLPMDVVIPVLPSLGREFHVPKKICSPDQSPPFSLESDPG